MAPTTPAKKRVGDRTPSHHASTPRTARRPPRENIVDLVREEGEAIGLTDDETSEADDPVEVIAAQFMQHPCCANCMEDLAARENSCVHRDGSRVGSCSKCAAQKIRCRSLVEFCYDDKLEYVRNVVRQIYYRKFRDARSNEENVNPQILKNISLWAWTGRPKDGRSAVEGDTKEVSLLKEIASNTQKLVSNVP